MITLPALSLSVVIGIAPLLFLPALPSLNVIIGLTALALLSGFIPLQSARYFALTLLFFCWGVLAAHQLIQPFEQLLSASHQVQVVIDASDNEGRHQARITHIKGKRRFPAAGVVLQSSPLPAAVCAGQRWQMQLRLRAVHGQLNDGGFDRQRYRLAQHLPLTGRVLSATLIDSECTLRHRYMAAVGQAVKNRQWGPIMLALGFGERSAVEPVIRQLLRDTGTAHLLAISGLHIGLAASIGWLIARTLQGLLPARAIGSGFPLLLMLSAAALYCWLAGGSPPALRALMALFIWSGLRLNGRLWHPWQLWICCVAGILLIDPLTILSGSFWLSAFAVAALIFWYQWVPFTGSSLPRWLRPLAGLCHLQCGMTLLLLPLQQLLFHGISLSSFIANLLAVPLVSLLIVPLVLAGMILNLSGWLWGEALVWLLTDKLLGLLFRLLAILPQGWVPLTQRFQWLTLLPWLLIIAWRLRGALFSPLLLAVVSTLLALPLWRKLPQPGWSLHMLDIGHGLAIVLERNGRALLYDTGNRWPGGDSGLQTIIPWLRWHGLRPEGVLLSHEHLDHIGGLASLQQAWPQLTVRSPPGTGQPLLCQRGQQWRWQELLFTVHWPPAGYSQQGNNRSCVVKVDDGQHSVLLTGDIEAPAELAMIKNHWQALHADILQVPHHGSRTSSTALLLSRVHGRVALASVARYNAWRLPSKKVTQRYRQQGYRWYDTAHSGQLTVHFNADGWQIKGLREHVLPRWYHQWFGAPAING